MLRDQPPHEEIARLLAHRLEESGQPRQTRVTVAELHKVLLPYHECRDALGFATKAEYDMALLRFMERGDYVRIGETELAEAVQKELSSPEPGLAFLRNFAAAQLHVRSPRAEVSGEAPPEAAEEPDERWLEALEPAADRDVANGGRDAGNGAGGDGAARAGRAEREPTSSGVVHAEASAACGGCGATLPSRPGLRFCPECGADQRALRCGRCGEELEAAWSYCPRCGAAAANGE